jgi:HEAT repeats
LTSRKPPPPSDEEPTEPRGAFGTVAQFFLVPLLVVGVCVGIFFLFSLLTFERKSPADYLADVKGGSANERWQSAFELSRAAARVPPGRQREKLGADTLEVFRRLHPDRAGDLEIKRYLALVLGRLAYAPARGDLQEASRDPDPTVRLYAVWALGMLGDRSAVPTVLRLCVSEDPGERKMAAYVLGKLGDSSAIPRLSAMASDHVADVRWNAAIALAELSDGSGREVLHSMLDRASLARQAENLKPIQAQEAMVNALKAEVMLHDAEVLPQIRALARGDPDMKVREEAQRAASSIAGAP